MYACMGMSGRMHVCIFVVMYVCICAVYMCVCGLAWMHGPVRVFACKYVCIYVCMYVCMFTRMRVCLRAHLVMFVVCMNAWLLCSRKR